MQLRTRTPTVKYELAAFFLHRPTLPNAAAALTRHLQGNAKRPRIIAVEPAACPSLTRGKYAYDFGDTGHMTPLVKMYTLGSSFTPPGFHAGGLRYHGMSTLVSHLKELGEIEAVAYQQRGCFDAAVHSLAVRASYRLRRPPTP